VRAEEFSISKRLIELEFIVNEKLVADPKGCDSSLATAAKQGNESLLKLLVDFGAEANIQLKMGRMVVRYQLQ
jgi:hypothetical protein